MVVVVLVAVVVPVVEGGDTGRDDTVGSVI